MCMHIRIDIYKYFKTALLVAALTVTASCKRENPYDAPVAEVDGVVLTKSKVYSAIPPAASSEDSALVADEYVRRWVYQQVVLRKSKLNLTDEEQDIEDAVAEYREALLVERFQQKVLKEKFKPNVTIEEVEKYYNEHKSFFTLNETLVKGLFVAVKKDTDGIKNFRKLITNMEDDKMAEIEDFVYHHALKYEMAFENWIPLASIKDYLPDNTIPNEAATLHSRKLAKTSNDENVYFILITDCKMMGEDAPIEYVTDKISSILTNKQKIEFIKNLKSQLYNDAMQQKLITYYE